MRKNSVVSRSRPSPSQNNTNNIAIIRPKRCHNCQKMFPADKFVLYLILLRINMLNHVLDFDKAKK